MTKKIPVVLTAIILVFPFWLRGVADAGPIANFSLEELCKKSTAIVVGRCVGVRSQWRGKVIVTVAEVEVSSYLKGDLGDKIEIITPGGRARVTTKNGASFPVRQSVQGTARFSKGEEILVFIKNSNGRNFVVGMQQGKQAIVTDKASGKKFVFQQQTKPRTNPKSEIRNPKSSASVSIRSTKPKNIRKLSLDDYTAQIAQNLAKISNLRKVGAQSADLSVRVRTQTGSGKK